MSTVILVREAAPHSAPLRATLESLNFQVLAELSGCASLHAEVVRVAPDLIIACTPSPDDDLLASLRNLSDTHPRPVIVFASDGRRDTIRKAVGAGVAAYVVDGWTPERLTPIIEAACARFDAHEAMRKELAATQNKLAERKLIEKAKGIVMHQRGLAEAEAYSALRKMAMNQNLALAEVARRVIAVSQLLG